MQTHLVDLFRDLVGLSAGGVIGYAFGVLQRTALRQNEERERSGKLKSGWSLMPGSGVRVAYLLLVLVLVQFICPLLFVEGTQWWVSGGVVAGYGLMLYQQLRLKMAQNRA
jgi:hypothetical protein